MTLTTAVARSFNAKSAKGAEGNVVVTFSVTRILSVTRCLLSFFSAYFALTAVLKIIRDSTSSRRNRFIAAAPQPRAAKKAQIL
jgi:hypothetical protein